MTDTTTTRTTQMHRVYIKATPEQVWQAITDPEWNARYGYPGHIEYDLKPGGEFRAVMPADMTHDVTDAPITAAMLEGSTDLQEGGGGWDWILSGLKTLLETGDPLVT